MEREIQPADCTWWKSGASVELSPQSKEARSQYQKLQDKYGETQEQSTDVGPKPFYFTALTLKE